MESELIPTIAFSEATSTSTGQTELKSTSKKLSRKLFSKRGNWLSSVPGASPQGAGLWFMRFSPGYLGASASRNPDIR